MANDPGEATNLLDSKQPEHVAARKKLAAVVAGFPKRDARPQYDPTPPQPWDRKPSAGGRQKKKAKKAAKSPAG